MRRYLGIFGAAAIVALGVGALALTADEGDGGSNTEIEVAANGQDVCGALDSGKIDTTGDPATVKMTAPEGSVIYRYCVKAGSDVSVPGGAVVYVDVKLPRRSITVGHPSGKAVSHYSFAWRGCEKCTTTTGKPTTTVMPTTTIIINNTTTTHVDPTTTTTEPNVTTTSLPHEDTTTTSEPPDETTTTRAPTTTRPPPPPTLVATE